jgi:acyl carrier protein
LKRALKRPSSTWCRNTVNRLKTQVQSRSGPNSLDKVEVAMEFAEEFATKFLDGATEKIVKVKDAVDFVVRQQCL